jgi:5-methylcytosine-specific restriction protein A
VESDFLNLTIEEGASEVKNIIQRKRSQKLRVEKIKEVKEKNEGKISCEVCGFNFSDVYDGYGEGFIEIHHLEPINLGETSKELEGALKKVVPLCANCHRMVHRKRDKLLTPEELKKIILEQSK